MLRPKNQVKYITLECHSWRIISILRDLCVMTAMMLVWSFRMDEVTSDSEYWFCGQWSYASLLPPPLGCRPICSPPNFCGKKSEALKPVGLSEMLGTSSIFSWVKFLNTEFTAVCGRCLSLRRLVDGQNVKITELTSSKTLLKLKSNWSLRVSGC